MVNTINHFIIAISFCILERDISSLGWYWYTSLFVWEHCLCLINFLCCILTRHQWTTMEHSHSYDSLHISYSYSFNPLVSFRFLLTYIRYSMSHRTSSWDLNRAYLFMHVNGRNDKLCNRQSLSTVWTCSIYDRISNWITSSYLMWSSMYASL